MHHKGCTRTCTEPLETKGARLVNANVSIPQGTLNTLGRVLQDQFALANAPSLGGSAARLPTPKTAADGKDHHPPKLGEWAIKHGYWIRRVPEFGLSLATSNQLYLVWDKDARCLSLLCPSGPLHYKVIHTNESPDARLHRKAARSWIQKWLTKSTPVYTVTLLRPWDVLAGADLTPVQRVFRLVSSEREDLFNLLVYASVIGLLSLATPIAVQSLFNTVAFGMMAQPLFVLVFGLLVCLSLSAVFRVFEHLIVEALSRRLFLKTVIDFSERAAAWSGGKSQNRKLAPRLFNRFMEVVTLEKTASALLYEGLSSLLQILVGLLLLAVYHPLLLLFALLIICGVAGCIFGLGRRANKTAIKESKEKHRLMAWIQDLSEGTLSVDHGPFRERVEDMADNWMRARKAHYRIHLRQLVFMFGLQAIAGGALLGLGGALVIRGQLTLGQLVAAEIVLAMTTSALGKLAKMFGKFYDLVAAVDKISEVTNASLDDPAPSTPPPGDDPISLQAKVMPAAALGGTR